MAEIVLIGMNHKSAPVEVREQLAVACKEKVDPLVHLPQLQHVDEMFFVSTCNRVEILFICRDAHEALEEVKRLLRNHLGDQFNDSLDQHFYTHHSLDAVKHLFRVASSLDSMVVGEPQILGQIKTAYRQATEHKTVGVILNRLLHKTFSVAKRVRSETCVGSYAVSISYAAVELARKIFGKLADKRVLLIGAGEMAELAAEHLLAQGVCQMAVANRTLERAVSLARRFRAQTVPFDHILDNLKNADIVLTSTGSPEPILLHRDVKSRMRERRNRPLFFIDIAVPRDIDPKINEIDNVYVYDIDDLQGVIDLNLEDRKREAERAEHIIAEETLKFEDWLCTLKVVPTIIALRDKAEAIRQLEIQKTLSHMPHLSESDRKAIEVLTDSIVRKILHDPILYLKRKSERETGQVCIDFTQQVFNLMERDGDAACALTHEASNDMNYNNLLKSVKK